MQVTFRAKIPDSILPVYKTKQSKQNTVAILGSSKTTNEILNYMDMCSNSVKAFVLSGRNIVHGCCVNGIMGAAYCAGKNFSKKNTEGKPEQSLAIITNPLWGDEDLENCVTIGTANSEADRIEKFTQVADTMLIFPGSTGTLQEAATLISKNYYGKEEDKKRIVLVGKEFFKGLDTQYKTLYASGLLRCKPEDLYTIVNKEEDIKNIIK